MTLPADVLLTTAAAVWSMYIAPSADFTIKFAKVSLLISVPFGEEQRDCNCREVVIHQPEHRKRGKKDAEVKRRP